MGKKAFTRLKITALVVILLFLGAAENTFAVNFTVTKTTDSNDFNCNADCSLREAVFGANSVGTSDTIVFAPNLIGQTITLSSAFPDIQVFNNGSLTITGFGANSLTIDGGSGTTRLFTVQGATFTLTGVTLTGGNGNSASLGAGLGGALSYRSWREFTSIRKYFALYP